MHDILPFDTLDAAQREQAADILRRALAHMSAAYATPEEAREEVARFDGDERIAFAALEAGKVAGWVGAVKVYAHAWELHPLVVDPACQRSGIGTRLCEHLEHVAAQAGVLTLYLGTDDDFGGTTLFGADLFDRTFAKIEALAPVKGHAFTFYRKLGWTVMGVIPDANGRGKPDIMMAKRVA